MGVNLRFISENLRSKYSTIPKSSKICDSCRKELSKCKELPSTITTIDSFHVDSVNFEREKIFPNDDLNSESEGSKSKSSDKYHMTGVEVLNQIKEKFKSSKNKFEKFQLLTLTPQSWTRKELTVQFKISDRQARNVKNVVKEHGILSLPNAKAGRSLNPETETLAINFYESDDVSRLMPGMKEYVSIKVDDKKIHVQKRLILCNLNELFCILDRVPRR